MEVHPARIALGFCSWTISFAFKNCMKSLPDVIKKEVAKYNRKQIAGFHDKTR